MKTFLQRSILGILFGAFLSLITIFAVIYLGKKDVLDSAILAKNALGTVFCAWFFTVTPLIFEIEKFSLPIQTVLHFLCVTVLYFIVGPIIGWIPFTVRGLSSMLGLFLLLYTVIWLAFYVYFRKQVKKLNKDLNNL